MRSQSRRRRVAPPSKRPIFADRLWDFVPRLQLGFDEFFGLWCGFKMAHLLTTTIVPKHVNTPGFVGQPMCPRNWRLPCIVRCHRKVASALPAGLSDSTVNLISDDRYSRIKVLWPLTDQNRPLRSLLRAFQCSVGAVPVLPAATPPPTGASRVVCAGCYANCQQASTPAICRCLLITRRLVGQSR
jgi:hypothetical protein